MWQAKRECAQASRLTTAKCAAAIHRPLLRVARMRGMCRVSCSP